MPARRLVEEPDTLLRHCAKHAHLGTIETTASREDLDRLACRDNTVVHHYDDAFAARVW
jgi:hypothetical protein